MKPVKQKKSWNDEQLELSVKESYSYRMVIRKIGLVLAGGNYNQVREPVQKLGIDVDYFTGSRWNVRGKKKAD